MLVLALCLVANIPHYSGGNETVIRLSDRTAIVGVRNGLPT